MTEIVAIRLGIIVVVTGGRNYADRQHVYGTLDSVNAKTPMRLLIEGGCSLGGADELARNWAEERDVPHLTVMAEWSRFGRAAGPLRNTGMTYAQPDLCVAFPGGAGTSDCVRQMQKAGVSIRDERGVTPAAV